MMIQRVQTAIERAKKLREESAIVIAAAKRAVRHSRQLAKLVVVGKSRQRS